jgi:uncharacterized coiled-coil protein SlyX
MELERYSTVEESDQAFINSYYEVKLAACEKRIKENIARLAEVTAKIDKNREVMKSILNRMS